MNHTDVIYLDNAASSWPKPGGVIEAMNNFIARVGANPGRSGHERSIEAGRILYDTREKLARLFNIEDPLRIIFCNNATEGLNYVILGYLHQGDHVICSGMEHNSVMRPLRYLEERGIDLTVVPCSADGILDPDDVRKSLRSATKLVVINHGSNVNGAVQYFDEVGHIVCQHEALLCVDAAQTAGSVPIDVEAGNIDMLVFTGHKGLFGPQGTGGLVLGKRVPIDKIRPLKFGGTGSRSEYEKQPEFLPDKFESGTPNTVGIAGLGAGVEFVLNTGIEKIRTYEKKITRKLIEGLSSLDGLSLFWSKDLDRQLSTISFCHEENSPSDMGFLLDSRFGIMTRTGLHCAPAAHQTLGTFPDGTVRLSPGYFTTGEHIEQILNAVEQIITSRQ